MNGKRFFTIGCLLENIVEQYQFDVWRGIYEEAEKNNVNLICFPGGRINDPVHYENQANILYQFAAGVDLDAAIILSNTIGPHLSEAQLSDFCLSYHPLPVLSVGCEFPGIKGIVIDNKTGIQELLAHLIQKHRFTKIALIGGPAGHQEAVIREEAFKSVLLENALGVESSLFEYGDFLEESGFAAMEALLRKNTKIDAVVALNDQMAIGAMKAIAAHGLALPKDICVVGFDDIPESRYQTPALTTVHQPLEQMGRLSLLKALELINGGETSSTVLTPQLVIRQSCGCFSADPKLPVRWKKSDPAKLILMNPSLIRPKVFAQYRKVQPVALLVPLHSEFRCKMSALLDCFFMDFNDTGHDFYLASLDKYLNEPETGAEQIASCDYLLMILWRNVAAVMFPEEVRRRIEWIREQSRVLIIKTMQRSLGFRYLEAEHLARKISEIGNKLIITFNMGKLFELIIDAFRQLGIKQGSLAMYEAAENTGLPTMSRLLLSYKKDDSRGNVSSEIRFETKHLYPPEIFETDARKSMIVLPLYFENEQLGFLVFQIVKELNPIIYDILAKQISSALKGSLLMGRIQKHADELEQKVRERTSELTKANRMLTNENQHRIRAEISLNESKNHLHAITEAIPIPFIISRISDGKILYSNSHCSPFFNAVQQTGEPLTIFNLFADRETIRDLLTLTKEKKHLPNIELSPQTLSRSFAWVLSTFQLLTFQGMESVILVFYDITERKQIEKLVAEIREKEQRRIGQDLHDDICQKLAGISVMVAVLEERLKKQKSEEARTAAGISELINDSIIQVKNIAKGLYPAELEQNQLATVLQNYSLKITEQFGVRCDFASNCREFKFDDFVSLHYYRIVQEAVNNAVRHAQPKTIKIALLASRLQTAVVIRDDGKGMPSGFTRTEGFGLRIMSYRANLIGAKLIIKPNRDHGTYVSCVMKNK